MEIVLNNCRITSEYSNVWDKDDCWIVIKIVIKKEGEDILRAKASDIIAAIEVLRKTCWRP